jgi:ABC-type dipeptide/oligopeptide/nickel transport system permease component
MVLGGFINGILTLVYLHRAWAYIQDLPNVFTTPGKAVGFLFIPLFNVVWLFFAYYNWAGDYNLRCALVSTKSFPKVSESLFLSFCILSVVGLPILYIFVMAQMCRAINHLAVEKK